MFAVQQCSFVSGLIVAREKFLHLPTQAYILTLYFSSYLFRSVFVFVSFSHTLPHTQTCCVQTPHGSFACQSEGVAFVTLFLRPAGRVRGHAKESRSFGASLLLKHSCVTASHTNTHKPLMLGGNHYTVKLYFLSISFMNEIRNCQRGFITPCVFSIRQSLRHI